MDIKNIGISLGGSFVLATFITIGVLATQEYNAGLISFWSFGGVGRTVMGYLGWGVIAYLIYFYKVNKDKGDSD